MSTIYPALAAVAAYLIGSLRQVQPPPAHAEVPSRSGDDAEAALAASRAAVAGAPRIGAR